MIGQEEITEDEVVLFHFNKLSQHQGPTSRCLYGLNKFEDAVYNALIKPVA
jgi:hypothetical protein